MVEVISYICQPVNYRGIIKKILKVKIVKSEINEKFSQRKYRFS